MCTGIFGRIRPDVKRLRVAAAVAVLVTVAACGTRLPDSAFVTTEGGEQAATGTPTGVGASGTNGTAGTTGSAGTAGTPSSEGTTTPGGTATPGGGGGGGGASGPNEASDVGVGVDSIKIGNITAQNGALGDAFEPTLRGLQAWVSLVNERGGINGRRVDLVTCDDKEDRTRNLECAQRLVEQDGVFAFVVNNSRAEGASAPYINDAGVPVFSDTPITVASYRYPHFWTIYGTGYERDGTTIGYQNQVYYTTGIYRWFRETLGTTVAAVFNYDIPESKQAGDFISRGLELEGYTVHRYQPNFANPTFDNFINDMKAKGVQIIFDAMDDGANRKLCGAMQTRAADFRPVAKVSTIVAYGQSVGTDFSDACRNIYYITGDSATYADPSNPVVAEFLDAYARYLPGEELHQWALEGFVAGKRFEEAVASMGASPTRQGLEDWLRSLNGYTSGGVWTPMDYQPVDYTQPTANGDCFAIAHWQDAAGGWVQEGGFPICYDGVHQYPAPPAESGD